MRGRKVYGETSGGDRTRTSVIGAYGDDGFFAPMVFEDSCDKEVVDVYFEHILLPALTPGTVIILDNASFHRASRATRLAEQHGCALLFLPPYSPDLNPIEHFWARLKTHLETILPGSEDPFSDICDACKFFAA